jgi:chromosome segregation ATPase
MIKKLLLYGVIIFAAYEGLSSYTAYTNRPTQHVGLPSTREEPAHESAFDKLVREDVEALAVIYESEAGRLNEIMTLLSSSNKSELGTQEIEQRYGRVSDKVALVAASFSAFHPKTSQVNHLHQQVVNSLNQLALAGREMKQTFLSVNEELAEADSLLALPKNEIGQHRGRLLEIRDSLAGHDGELHRELDQLQSHGRTAVGAIEELETLASARGIMFRMSAP